MKTATWRDKYGPWAVVTGASDGIGRELALRTAERGLNLVLVARRREPLERLAAEAASLYRVETKVIAADLASPGAAEGVVAATDDLRVGLLIAAAGFGTSGPFLDSDLSQELQMVDVNCRAVTAMSLLYGRRFAKQGGGGMILFSSLLAFQGVPRAANYAATKAYVQSLAEGLHHELSPAGVDVLACAPGPIRSGFAARANMQMGLSQTPQDIAQATLNALGHRITVRPGWLSKFLELSLSTAPRWGRVRILSLVMGGMTKHQHGKTKAQDRASA